QGDSLSERILRSANGPPAVLSSTEVSHPYANAIFTRELSQALAARQAPTVGLAFVEAKRQTLVNDDALRQTIDAQVGLLLDVPTRVALKRSHQYMYTLFGDPAMRLAWPGGGVVLTVPTTPVTAGTDLTVSATFTALAQGQATVTLETRRSAYRGALVAVPADNSPGRNAAIIANYATANNPVVVSATTAIAGSALSVKLAVPADLAPGEYVVKLYADDGVRDAAASATITVP
ncbi:MAG: hypothetical protein H6Q89_4136, partial [Myxococcaceae bacterium]|nr:hypothetical protein [Myxococcaceae bacterium]